MEVQADVQKERCSLSGESATVSLGTMSDNASTKAMAGSILNAYMPLDRWAKAHLSITLQHPPPFLLSSSLPMSNHQLWSFKNHWLDVAETTAWKSRQTWRPNQRNWGTTAAAAAWTKPAAAARPAWRAAAEAPAAAARSPKVTPPPAPPSAAKVRRGKKAKVRGTQTPSWRSSAARTRQSSTPRRWAAACPRWLTRTAATSRRSWAAPSPRRLGRRRSNRIPQRPSAKQQSPPCPRWSTTAWSSASPVVAMRASPPAAFRRRRRRLRPARAAACSCTSARKSQATSPALSQRGRRGARPNAPPGGAAYRQTSEGNVSIFATAANSVSLSAGFHLQARGYAVGGVLRMSLETGTARLMFDGGFADDEGRSQAAGLAGRRANVRGVGLISESEWM